MRRYWLVTGERHGGRFEVPDTHIDVSFAHARMIDVDFTGVWFISFVGHDSVFERCDFTRTHLDHVLLGATGYGGRRWDGRSWPETVFRERDFTRTRMPPDTYFGNARFDRCVFDCGSLRDQTATEHAQFIDCTFRGTVNDVCFWGTPTRGSDVIGRDRNAFTGNDFTAAALVDVEFRNIDLRAQRFPEPPGYALLDHADQRVAAALAALAGWPDDAVKADAEQYLRNRAEDAVEYTESYLLASPHEIGQRLPAEAREQIYRMLVDYQHQ
ncbi:pentapeptide repeat-containing protein [Actinoplanes palleronii]|uniref:pentapeptide repeat-containing protein n=1 Tax=Actinoplanes palleronii TaxID=113570 RepID=UPI001944E56F|nr:hypothetical protein [Actinoplanes palleronii]